MTATTSEDLTPRARAKRDQIRGGAQRLFLKRGFAETSTDAIASEAGVSKQTLYAYYPSKEELLADVLRQLVGAALQEWPLVETENLSLESREELREALGGLAHEITAGIMREEYVALVRVIVSETPRLPQLGELFRATVAEKALQSVRVLLERAREQGVIQEVDLDAASRLLVGPLLTYSLLDGLLAEGPPSQPDPERIEAIVDLYIKAITP